jgi:hypothetical protein
MRKNLVQYVLLSAVCAASVFTSCKREETIQEAPNYSWSEEFDTVQNAVDRGWVIVNNSRPAGAESWIQGIFGVTVGKTATTINGYGAFSSMYSGTDYTICTYNACIGNGTISAWLFAPETLMKNGDQIEFYTRTLKNPADFADRLQVRLNPLDAGVEIGDAALTNAGTATAVGNYRTLLLDINPNQVLSGTGSYPGSWTKYTVTISGLPAPLKRRFAFRYFVTNGGTTAPNSEGVAIDAVKFISR